MAVGGIGTAIHIVRQPEYTAFERAGLRRYAVLWLAGAAGSDAMIAGVMCWHFVGIHSNHQLTPLRLKS
jgi:hypothetical protein